MMLITLFKLLIIHALTDFSLQTDSMAKGKNRNRKPDYVPEGQKLIPCWGYWLTAHALISGGGIWFVTGLWYLGLIEIVLHWIIDFLKCDNKMSPNKDQLLHFLCRVFYVTIF